MKKGVITYFITYVLYVIFLMICFSSYLVNAYGYYGFKNTINTSSLAISLFILTITFFLIYKQKTDTYSRFIIYILVLINFVPSVVTFCYMPFSYIYLLLLVTYWLMMIFFVNVLNNIHFKDNSKRFKSNIFNVYLVLVVELVVMLLVIRYTGINLNFSTVYDLRNIYFQAKIPTVLSYLYSSFKVVNPLLFVYLYNRKKMIGYSLSVIIQICAFLADGSKSTLFSLILAFIIIKYVQNRKINNFLDNDKLKYYILLGLVAVNILGFIEFRIIKTSFLYNYFIRRTFFLPPLLNHYYYDFFSIHSFDYFKQSFLGKLGFNSIYSMKIQNIIGQVYFSAPTMFANNGLFSDAYMNLGAIGMVFMPFLLCLALRFLDYCAKNVNSYYLIMVLISVSYTFISSSYFTVLLTHGFILLCLIILIILPKDGSIGEKHE